MLFDYLLNIYNYFFFGVHVILPNLWLSDANTALDTEFLKENNIDVIINCTPTVPFAVTDKKIELFRIPVNDSLLEKDFLLMEDYFGLILPYLLQKYITEKKKILIHCFAGKQRSAIVVAAFLKVLLDKKLIDLPDYPQDKSKQLDFICNYMLSKRPQVFTYGFRLNFRKTFERYFAV